MAFKTAYHVAACPVCATQDIRQLADANQMKAEMETLWEFHLKRTATGAPIDQLFDRAIFSQPPPLQLSRCRGCGTVMRNPVEDAEEVVETYAQEEPDVDAFDSLFEAQQAFYRPRVDRLTKLNQGPGSVLEVGSYIGAFLTVARAAGWTARGVDVNARASAYARSKGADVSESTLEEMKAGHSSDVVAIWNCFDQLPHPRKSLLAAASQLKPKGLIALRIPNGACYAALQGRRSFQPFLAHNNLLGFPYRYGFTPLGLRTLLAECGFEIVRMRGDTLVSTAGQWTHKWARVEERAVKRSMKMLLPRRLLPWIEVYARLAY